MKDQQNKLEKPGVDFKKVKSTPGFLILYGRNLRAANSFSPDLKKGRNLPSKFRLNHSLGHVIEKRDR